MENHELLELLHSKQSAKRRRAAKKIGELQIEELSEALFQAYLQEKADSRTWQTQVEMIRALGLMKNTNAIEIIRSIVDRNQDGGMIIYAAAECYARLKREHRHDAKPVIELLKMGNRTVSDGCLNALGYDRMVPTDEEIKELIELSWNLHVDNPRGATDPRYGIAAACAGWKPELVDAFLNHCLDTAGRDTPLIYVSKNALNRKYVRLR